MTEREGKDTLVQTSHIILTNLKPKSNKTKLIAVKKKKRSNTERSYNYVLTAALQNIIMLEERFN